MEPRATKITAANKRGFYATQDIVAACDFDEEEKVSRLAHAFDGLSPSTIRNQVNSVSSNGRTALLDACGLGYVKVAKVLLGSGADIELPGGGTTTPVFEAAFRGKADVMRVLLQAGASVAPFKNAGAITKASVVVHNCLVLASVLLEHGFEPCVESYGTGTYVEMAATYGQDEMVEMFLNYQT